jgi:hypothetical protein
MSAILARVSSELMVARPEPAAVEPDRAEWWLLDRLALASATLSGLVLYALIGRGGWYIDDFLNFGIAQHSGLNRRYIDLPILGHPQQGTRLVNWLLFRIAPMNYHLASALVCLSIAIVAWMVYRILRLSFRPSPWHLVLTTLAGTSGLWVPVAAWWAGGSEIAGCVLASVLATHAMLCSYRGPRRLLWSVLAACWLLVGLTFYERALFGGVFAAWYVLAVHSRSARPRELLRVLRRIWPGYLALLTVAIGYLGYYLSHHFVRTQPGYTKSELLHYLWVCWSHSLVPALFGGTLHTGQNLALSYADPRLWWLTTCQLALLALLGYGIRRNGWRALLGWLAFLVLFLPAQYSIATARLHVHGSKVGDEFRYLADLFPLAVLTIGLTVLRPATTAAESTRPTPDQPAADQPRTDQAADRPDPDQAASRPRRLPPVRRSHLIATGAALAALWTVFLISALPVSHRWLQNRGIRYVDNLRAGVAAHDRQGPWSMYTTTAPQTVILQVYGPYALTPTMAELVSGHPVSADDLSKPMFVVDPDGRLRPARFRALATVPAACSTGRQKILEPVSRPLAKGLWNVQLNYRVSRPTTLRFALDPGTGTAVEATGMFRGFPVSGSGRLTFALRLSAITGFRLDAAVAGVCVSDVQIGQPVPA